MKKSFIVAAISIFAMCFGGTVDKGYHECHKTVYGRAEYHVTEDIFLPFGLACTTRSNSVDQNNIAMLKLDDNVPYVTLGTVPVAKVSPVHKIKFKNGVFTIEHTGTYVVHYFFKAFSDCLATCPITIAIRVNKKLVGIKKLNPMPHCSALMYEGNGVVIKNLDKGDKVSLEVIGLPDCIPNGVDAFNANTNESHLAMLKTGGSIFYSNMGDVSIPDIAAYLMIHKAEQDY